MGEPNLNNQSVTLSEALTFRVKNFRNLLNEYHVYATQSLENALELYGTLVAR